MANQLDIKGRASYLLQEAIRKEEEYYAKYPNEPRYEKWGRGRPTKEMKEKRKAYDSFISNKPKENILEMELPISNFMRVDENGKLRFKFVSRNNLP